MLINNLLYSQIPLCNQNLAKDFWLAIKLCGVIKHGKIIIIWCDLYH